MYSSVCEIPGDQQKCDIFDDLYFLKYLFIVSSLWYEFNDEFVNNNSKKATIVPTLNAAYKLAVNK